MIDSKYSNINSLLRGENFKEIEDVIDARKRLGQYNVYKHANQLNTRCVYSSFQKPHEISNRSVKFDEISLMSADRESSVPGASGIRHTDSEITIVRIKCTGGAFKRKFNKWDMDDIAIPGDGTHLGESPSLVNLATLVAQNVQCEGDDEYLVPLSSWDPLVKNADYQAEMQSSSDSKINEKYTVHSSYTDPNIPCRLENSSGNLQTDQEFEETIYQAHRHSWAGKFSKFWRKHWHKQKSLKEQETVLEVAGHVGTIGIIDSDNQNKNDV